MKNVESCRGCTVLGSNIVAFTGGRHGSDSAVGSSATLSGDQAPSSPPSWASSPPASPDSAVTAVSYIPDQQAVLQRVSFTTSSEVRQVGRSTGQQEASRSTTAPYTPSITSIGGAVLRRVYNNIQGVYSNLAKTFPENSLIFPGILVKNFFSR
ncbi:rho gtpase-activating protein 6 [Lasius niger]|uniref:Rho gtpase-activating protein 6 n=1 Tax=Lasius niger TaxID=67767 RepID=A0A0J7KJC8_LASNI|nr:rho gtpase-activating protein 6 [Lasius niger]